MADLTDDPRNNDDQFSPDWLDKTVIAIPLLKSIEAEPEEKFHVIIDLHLGFKGGQAEARSKVISLLSSIRPRGRNIKNEVSTQYVFAYLYGTEIRSLVEMDNKDQNPAIYKIWLDFEVRPLTIKSISTVKADAARFSFSALGHDITWAVVDSGINFKHPHFQIHANKHADDSYHVDFTGEDTPCNDVFGHGTHVAGIIGGEWYAKNDAETMCAVVKIRDENGKSAYLATEIPKISGMAPRCQLVSIRVLDAYGKGLSSSLLAAIEHIQRINGYGRDIKIHGVNMSLGYTFDPEWFACGQSPLCVEVNRLVKSGVVVVVAAGNTGYGYTDTAFNGRAASGIPLSINDPGNAELAITVGSTHRDMPHTYGVSYFSSKGPTGDGRLKPDLVAPGEKIISCAAGIKMKNIANSIANSERCNYIEDSGTSMAAPHVSGVIAAFLSIRREYIGNPEAVKNIFMSTATDLKRDAYFQGRGLVDLMRAIQSI